MRGVPRAFHVPAALLWVLAATGVATAAEPKWEVSSGKYLTEVRVKDVPKGTGIIWDVFPRDKCQKKVVKSEQSCTIAGEPGDYEIVVRLVSKSGDDFDIEEYTKIITLGGVQPNPGPGPNPNPGPTPTPEPDRKGVAYKIIWVEETDDTAAGRGAIWTNKALAARVKDKGHSLRIVDKDNTAPDVQEAIGLAKGKSFPQVFLQDKAGKLKLLQFDAPPTATKLLELLDKWGG